MPGRLEDLAMWGVLKLLGVWHLAQCIAITAPAIFVFGCVACVVWSSHGLVPNGSQAGAASVLANNLLRHLQEEGSFRAPTSPRANHHGTVIHKLGQVESSCVAIR